MSPLLNSAEAKRPRILEEFCTRRWVHLWIALGLFACRPLDGAGFEMTGGLSFGNGAFAFGERPTDRFFWFGSDGERWLTRIWTTNAFPTATWCLAGGARGGSYSCVYPRDDTNACMAWAGATNVPRFYDEPCSFIWLGLATTCYQGTAPDLPPPVALLHDREDQRAFRASWERFDAPPHFPCRMVYRNAGYRLTPGSKHGDEVIRLDPPYDQGYTQAVFQVLKTTNIGGCLFPLQYVWQRFSAGPIQRRQPTFKVVEQVEVRLEHVALRCDLKEFVPSLGRNAGVMDDRLIHNTNIGRLNYPVYDGRWRSVAELPKLHKARQARKTPRKPVPGLLGLLIVLAILPPAVYGVARAVRRAGKRPKGDTPQASLS
jgi:hypothetical protein